MTSRAILYSRSNRLRDLVKEGRPGEAAGAAAGTTPEGGGQKTRKKSRAAGGPRPALATIRQGAR